MQELKEIERSSIQRVLLCNLRSHGDVLLSSPVLSVLKRAFPHAQLDMCVMKESLPMCEGHPAVSEYIVVKKGKGRLFSRLRHELKTLLTIRKNQYDLVIDLYSFDREFFVALFSGAKVKVGVQGRGGFVKKDWVYTRLRDHTLTPKHIVERHLDSLRVLGIHPQEEEKELFFPLSKELEEEVMELVPFDQYVIVHPISRCSFKNWSVERFAEVIKDLKRKGKKVIISGGPSKEEKEQIEHLIELTGKEGVLSLAGKTSLKGLAALIKNSEMLICVDSVPAHMASLYKRPLVVIFGPSNDLTWGPWRNPHARVVRLDVPCMRCDQEGCGRSWVSDCLIRLPAQQVIDAVGEIFNEERSTLQLI